MLEEHVAARERETVDPGCRPVASQEKGGVSGHVNLEGGPGKVAQQERVSKEAKPGSVCGTALQSKKAVSAYITSKQILPSGSACNTVILFCTVGRSATSFSRLIWQGLRCILRNEHTKYPSSLSTRAHVI